MKSLKYYLRKLHILNEKEYADKPKKWNCCEELVTPRNLSQHIKDNHMKGHKITLR